MSAPLTTREALAAALVEVCTPPMGDRRNPQTIAWGERCADALLASGALIDATTLAEDEALVDRVAFGIGAREANGVDRESYWDIVLTNSTRAGYRTDATNALTALAAALSAQSERAEVTHCANCGREVPVDKPHHVGECAEVER